MNPPDEMLAIETHDGQQIPRTYPALMNGNNHVITSAMTPYNTPKSSIVVPANMSKGGMMGNPAISSNNFPSLDYGNHSAMMPTMNGRIPGKKTQAILDQQSKIGSLDQLSWIIDPELVILDWLSWIGYSWFAIHDWLSMIGYP